MYDKLEELKIILYLIAILVVIVGLFQMGIMDEILKALGIIVAVISGIITIIALILSVHFLITDEIRKK